ncbi:MAG: hypothetical protein WCH61_01230 [bacterium]
MITRAKVQALCFIVVVAVLPGPVVFGDDLALSLREAELARQNAEQRCAELSVALVRSERELERERQRLAALQLQARRQQEALDALQAQTAGWLLAADTGLGPGIGWHDTLARLEVVQAGYRAASVRFREFGGYVTALLDSLGTSEAVRQEVRRRFDEVIRTCERLEASPPIVAGRGGVEETGLRVCRVRSVEAELGVVMLDAGTEAGVRPGGRWRVYQGDRVVARLRVVDTRPGVSAAIPVEGRVAELAPGLRVQAGE